MFRVTGSQIPQVPTGAVASTHRVELSTISGTEVQA